MKHSQHWDRTPVAGVFVVDIDAEGSPQLLWYCLIVVFIV
jgi:hypothetical protein